MVKNVRTYSSRVKTGCITCRRRRIKCDEAKPSCQRCTAGKRPCEGYAPQVKAAPAMRMIMYTPSTPVYPAADPERNCFQFFLAQSRACFPLEFSRAILQAAQMDRAFTHAIVCFGAAQQIYEYEDDPDTRARLGKLAMVQYGKALHLLQSPSAAPSSTETLLLCCVLFACYEGLRGCRRSAVVHIKSGLDLLRQCGAQTRWALLSREAMIALFTRLDNQVVELLGTAMYETLCEKKPTERVFAPRPLTVELSVPAPRSQSGSAAPMSIDTRLNHIFHRHLDMAEAMEALPDLPPAPEDESRLTSPTPLPPDDPQGHFPTDEMDAELLHIWHMVAHMCVAMAPGTAPEEAWDDFFPEFETIVSLAERYLGRSRPSGQKRKFGFSIGVIPALYMAGVRCREPRIRRRAIRLLAEYPRREIMWDSTVTAEVCRRVMEIEEGTVAATGDCLGADGSSGTPASGYEGSGIKLVTRVRNVSAVLDDDGGARFEFQQ
ncbi:hypothetical protein BJX68DRAFT_235469 [Aspergillus pseudodeflectus]|uniref:Zn(2)-C6 fungal-type domain-containing protein n=1 Tax=Aspergillus pseudodeflectus TaxID=176178 RepID=A0ABR4KHB4_9EURO